MSDATAPSMWFTASQVDSDTVIIFTLSVSDGMHTVLDSTTITVMQQKLIAVTHVDVGGIVVPFIDYMIINNTPKFEGTSSGIEKIRIMLCGQQVGGNNIRADGGWTKSQTTPLPIGICDLLGLDHLTGEVLYTARVLIR